MTMPLANLESLNGMTFKTADGKDEVRTWFAANAMKFILSEVDPDWSAYDL